MSMDHSADYEQGYADGKKRAYLEFSLARAFHNFSDTCDCEGHVLTRQFLENPSVEIEFDPARATALHNAQGEIDNAIANAFVHFPLPGGSKGRYHDTLCGASIHWTHVEHFVYDNAEAEREARTRVTCPVCLEGLEQIRND